MALNRLRRASATVVRFDFIIMRVILTTFMHLCRRCVCVWVWVYVGPVLFLYLVGPGDFGRYMHNQPTPKTVTSNVVLFFSVVLVGAPLCIIALLFVCVLSHRFAYLHITSRSSCNVPASVLSAARMSSSNPCSCSDC